MLQSCGHPCSACVAPTVEYCDWAELVSLAYNTQHEYLKALYSSLDDEIKNNSILKSRLLMWSRNVSSSEQYMSDLTTQGPVQGPDVSRFVPVFTDSSLQRIRDIGGEILLRMTKGCGVQWCIRINNIMCRYLLRVAQMFCNIYSSQADPQHRQHFFDLMREEVSYLFSGGLPMCLCSDQGFLAMLLTRNFCILARLPYALQQQMRMHPLQDLWSPESMPSVTVLSHAQFREMMLTLAMGSHARLGRDSVLLCLLPDTLQVICQHVLLQNHVCAHLFHQEEMWLF